MDNDSADDHAATPRYDADHHQHPRRVFYGWYVALACSAIAFVTWGVAFYNLGVFLHFQHERRGWSTALLSLGVTVFYCVAGLTGLAAGRVVDRYGPRVVLVFGGVAMGAAILGLGRATRLWEVYVFDAALAVGFGCCHSLVLGAVITRWFRTRRALAMTIALSGGSIGGFVLVPASTAVIAHGGLALDGTVLAIIAWGIVLPAALLVVRDQPQKMGLLPDGAGETQPERTGRTDAPWTARAALRTWAWWCPTLAFMLTLMGQIGFLVHEVSFLNPLLGAAGAALAVSLTTAGSLAGRVILGGVGDRITTRTAAVACIAIQGVAVALAASSPHAPMLLFACALFGLTTGNTIALQPLMMAERFGLHAYGAIYGPAYLVTQLGSASGPLLVGILADRLGGYAVPFGATACAAGAAALLLLVGPAHSGPVPKPSGTMHPVSAGQRSS